MNTKLGINNKKTINFMGILANVDSSVLKINLDHSFKIQSMSENEVMEFFPMLIRQRDPMYELFIRQPCYNANEKRLYYVSNAIDVKELSPFTPEESKFDNELVRDYLNKKIRLMRLFKEGNVCMPTHYYYIIENGIPDRVLSFFSNLPTSAQPKYTLADSEISDLNTFIQETKLFDAEYFLRLAFDSFELSYQISNTRLQFLSLITSLDAILSPCISGQERISITSGNVALFLREDERQIKEIFSDIKNFYEKKRKIFYGENVDEEDIRKLRGYVRDSIKKSIKINMTNKIDRDKLVIEFGQKLKDLKLV